MRRSILYVPVGNLWWAVFKVGSVHRGFGELVLAGSFVVVGKVGGDVGVLPAFVCNGWVTFCIFGCGGRVGCGGRGSFGITFAEVGVVGWVFEVFRGDSGVVAVEVDFRLGRLVGVVSVNGGGL